MTTPPPPPGPADWPSSQPASMAVSAGRQSWWTGGRIVAAVVLVLVLMGGAGFAGFLAGLAVGNVESVIDGSDITIGGGGDTSVPGFTDLDSDAVAGPSLRRGGATPGALDEVPVDHPLTVETTGQVVITLSSDDFDTVLVLLDEEGALVASDDDGAGVGTDSLLDLELAPGTYTVRVQSWGSSGAGNYSVTVG